MSWTKKKLGDICEIYQPQTITSNEISKEGPFKVFGANGVIGYYSKYNHEDSEVLVTCRGATCGTLNMSEPKSWVTGNAMVVHSKDEKSLSKSFLYYILSGSNLSRTITGTGQPQITRNSLGPFQIPFPPLKIQKQIVERLDKIVEAQKLNDKLIQKTDELFRAFLHRELDPADKNWGVKKFGEVIDINFGERITKTKNSGNKFPVYGGGGESFRTDAFNRENEFVISRFAIAENCVRFVEGKFWLMDSGGTFSIQKDFKNKLDKNFIGNVLLMRQKEIYNCARGGAQKNIDVGLVKKIKISLPPFEIQKQIAIKLLAIQDYKKQLLEQKAKLKELFDSVLYKSMKGN